MFENLTPAEQLLFATVRIECLLPENRFSVGTGFFFSFKHEEWTVPLLITNKHVVDRAVTGTFIMTRRSPDNKPLMTQNLPIRMDNFQQRWIPHPESDIDLCAMPVAQILETAQQRSMPVYYRHIGAEYIANQQQLEELDAIEEVLMIGYPNGVWDQVNNMPVVRRGITATHPAVDFDGKPLELIDIACFPGSSGSPILLYSAGSRRDRQGNTTLGGITIKLLGVVFASKVYTATGEIRTMDIPTATIPIAATQVHSNLAIMIKAQKLLDFIPIFKQLLNKDQV